MTAVELESLPLWQRRTIAMGLLFVATLLLVFLVLWPALTLVLGHRAWQEQAAATLSRYQALAERRAEIEAQLQSVGTHPVWNTLYSGIDAAAATNALQTEMRGVLDALQIPVQVSAPLDPQSGRHLTRIGVRLGVQLTIDQLQALLERVQAQPRRLWLDNVTITAPQYQSPDANPSLQLQFEAWGFMRRIEAA